MGSPETGATKSTRSPSGLSSTSEESVPTRPGSTGAATESIRGRGGAVSKTGKGSDACKGCKAGSETPALMVSTTQAASQQLSEESLPRVVAALDAAELSAQLTAAARLRRLLSADDPPIKEAVGRGAVPRLVELLRRDSSPRLQLEAAWALTNIASGAPEHVRAVVDGRALHPLCRLLRASDSAVREQAAWALGNIAGDGAVMRDLVLEAGALAPLVRTLRDVAPTSAGVTINARHQADHRGSDGEVGGV